MKHVDLKSLVAPLALVLALALVALSAGLAVWQLSPAMILNAVGGDTSGAGSFASHMTSLATSLQPYVLAATPLGLVIAGAVAYLDHRNGMQHFGRIIFVALLVTAAPTIAK